MSLRKPTVGQIIDRLTILELKLKRSAGAHFKDEQRVLLDLVPNPEMMPQYQKLRAVNLAIWEANEYIAALSLMKDPAPNDLALQMWRWNMERSELIEGIDRAVGDYAGREKV